MSDEKYFDYTKKPPEKYIEGYIKYICGVDIMPDWFTLRVRGYTNAEAEKMLKLISIESLKYHFEEIKAEDKPTAEEIKEYENLITRLIEEYNDLHKLQRAEPP